MSQNDILMLGLGLTAPWKLIDQHLDTNEPPHELQLEIGTDRGTQYPCPTCQEKCSAHDYQTRRWRHLIFFQYHCYITAKIPRIKCPEHGFIQVPVTWARAGSRFILLFEQVVLSLIREMPVRAVAKHRGNR